MTAPQSWDCPICLRHVPAKVGECYCGYKRSDPRPEARSGGGAASLVLGLVGLFAIGGGLAYWLKSPPPAVSGEATPPPTLAAGPGVPAHHPNVVPPSTTLPEAWKALAIEASATPPAAAAAGAAPATPTPAPQATPDDSIDAQRAKGLTEFEAALGGLQAKANDFREKLKRYNDQCMRENTQVTGCDPARAELQEYARQIANDVEAADEAARRSWLEAGQRRNLRESKGLDESGVRELLKAAADAARR